MNNARLAILFSPYPPMNRPFLHSRAIADRR